MLRIKILLHYTFVSVLYTAVEYTFLHCDMEEAFSGGVLFVISWKGSFLRKCVIILYLVLFAY